MTDAALTRDDPKPPSPPWYGAVSTVLLGLMAVILLTYTLLDWEWQQALGAWNYVVVGGLVVVTSVWMTGWRADLARHEPVPEPAAAPAAAGEGGAAAP